MELHNPRPFGGGMPIRSPYDDDRARFDERKGGSAGRTTHGAEVRARLDALAGTDPVFRVDGLIAGYGWKEILRGIDLRLAPGQLLCLIGPNGAGKSTILHSIFGLTDIRSGRIEIGGRNVTRLGPNARLRDAGIACVLRDSSLFPDMTVEQNLWLGSYLMGRHGDTRHATERVFDCYPSLAARRDEPARAFGRRTTFARDLARTCHAAATAAGRRAVDRSRAGLRRAGILDAPRSSRARTPSDRHCRAEREKGSRIRGHRLRYRRRRGRDRRHRR